MKGHQNTGIISTGKESTLARALDTLSLAQGNDCVNAAHDIICSHHDCMKIAAGHYSSRNNFRAYLSRMARHLELLASTAPASMSVHACRPFKSSMHTCMQTSQLQRATCMHASTHAHIQNLHSGSLFIVSTHAGMRPSSPSSRHACVRAYVKLLQS